MPSKVWFKTILVAALVAAAGLVFSALASPTILGPDGINREEWNVFAEINSHRSNNGLPTVVLSRKLSNVAAAWSRQMASDDSLYHPTRVWLENRVRAQGYPWQYPYVADICAGGVAFSGETAQQAINAWRASTLHNNVILERGSWSMADWRAVGIGQVYDSSTNKWFWTAIFGEVNDGDNIGAPHDNIDPSVSITNPANGSTVRGVVTVTASASDTSGIAFVEFYLNPQPSPPWTTLQSTDGTSPYTHIWDTTTYPYGSATWGAKAYDQNGNTEYTTVTVNVDNTPPPQVTGLTVTDTHDGRLDLSWNPNPAPDLKEYWVYRSTTSGVTGSQIATVTAPSHSYQDTGLTNGQTYYYRVSAVDNAGNEGPKSAQASGTPTASHGDVRFKGTITTDENHGVIPICYGDYFVTVTVTQILDDPENLLVIGMSVEVCYQNPLNINAGENIEVYGHYWKYMGPMQLVGRVAASGDSYYIRGENGPVRFTGTVITGEQYGDFVCYGSHYVEVSITQILDDPKHLLRTGGSLEVCYENPLSLEQGDNVEIDGYYWKHFGPMQAMGRVEASYITTMAAPEPALQVPDELCEAQGKTISATDVCNNNIGYSDPGPAGGEPHCVTADCCGWYQKSHVHDLGRIILKSDLIVEYIPGFSDGCKDTVTIAVSADNRNWTTVRTLPTTTVDLNPPHQTWKKYMVKIHAVTSYRYVKVTIPKCYNDYSAVYVCEEIIPPAKAVTLTVKAMAGQKIQMGPITIVSWIEVNVPITSPWEVLTTPFSKDVEEGQAVLLIAPPQMMMLFGTRQFSEWKCNGNIYSGNSLLITTNRDMVCTAYYRMPEEPEG